MEEHVSRGAVTLEGRPQVFITVLSSNARHAPAT
jgi:hypothetical protein